MEDLPSSGLDALPGASKSSQASVGQPMVSTALGRSFAAFGRGAGSRGSGKGSSQTSPTVPNRASAAVSTSLVGLVAGPKGDFQTGTRSVSGGAVTAAESEVVRPLAVPQMNSEPVAQSTGPSAGRAAVAGGSGVGGGIRGLDFSHHQMSNEPWNAQGNKLRNVAYTLGPNYVATGAGAGWLPSSLVRSRVPGLPSKELVDH